ncbi:MAG: succinate dehydrogenase assembly factor 2 [Pseudomonadota bacterium]
MTDIDPYFVKKLLYQSKHRGCKETDLLLGKFADQFLHNMENKELEDYATILMQTDADIVDWIMDRADVPKGLESEVMKKLVKFGCDVHKGDISK